MPEQIKATVVKPTPVTQLSIPATENTTTEPQKTEDKKPAIFPFKETKTHQKEAKEDVDWKEKFNSLKNENKKLLDGIKSVLGMETEKSKEKSSNENIIKFIEKKFKERDEKEDQNRAELEYAEFINRFSKELGLKSKDQVDYLEYELSKLLDAKGDNVTDADYEKLGNKIKTHYGITKASTVIPQDTGPSQSISDSSGITYKQFKEMDIMQRNDLYTSNPELFDKYLDRENASKMNLGE